MGVHSTFWLPAHRCPMTVNLIRARGIQPSAFAVRLPYLSIRI